MSPHLDATTAVEPRLASTTTQEVDDRRWWILGVLVLSLVCHAPCPSARPASRKL